MIKIISITISKFHNMEFITNNKGQIKIASRDSCIQRGQVFLGCNGVCICVYHKSIK